MFIFKAPTISSLRLNHDKDRIKYQYGLEQIIVINNDKLMEHNSKCNICLSELD